MISVQLKLKPTKTQQAKLEQWLFHLTGVWNWAVRKFEADKRDGVRYSLYTFKGLLANHSVRLGVPGVVLQDMLGQAYTAWERCLSGVSRKPRFRGERNRLNSFPFHADTHIKGNRIKTPGLSSIPFHKQNIPLGRITTGRIIRRASGWYVHLTIDGEREPITRRSSDGAIGVDPGFTALLTLSTGEKILHPRESEAVAKRMAQAQRGNKKKLTARLHERVANRIKDRNHKLSLRLVRENSLIVFSKYNIAGQARRFGKSVASSAHAQLRHMLAYKSRSGGTRYVEVDSRFSTMTCSNCGARNGPTGLSGLAVRTWRCACGTNHDRDINAALNTLQSGLGSSLKASGDGSN